MEQNIITTLHEIDTSKVEERCNDDDDDKDTNINDDGKRNIN
jgi:hypothetical protein